MSPRCALLCMLYIKKQAGVSDAKFNAGGRLNIGYGYVLINGGCQVAITVLIPLEGENDHL